MRRPRLSKQWRRRLIRAGLGGALCWALVYFAVPLCLPFPDGLEKPPAPGLEITDLHGKPLRKLLSDGARVEAVPEFAKISTDLVNATLAAEDKRFWDHGGIDFLAAGRSLRDSLSSGRTVSGASTVTQQLIKISSRRQQREITTKLYEMFAARKIEISWSKERILTEYLNRLNYGNLRVGCASAARGYFGKPLADCSLAECAFLAGLPQAPGRLNPYRNFAAAKRRQEWVLGRMLASGTIDEKRHRRATAEPLRLRQSNGAFEAPHFVDYLLERTDWESATVENKLRTSLDFDLQTECEDRVAAHLERLTNRRLSNAAFVVIENASGAVRAMSGSRDYSDPDGGQFNGALAPRSPGSTLKPFTYLLALQDGDTAATVVDDLPIEFMTDTGIYRPSNFDRRSHGPVSYRVALASSLNISAVRTLDHIGGAAVLTAALSSCGITTLTESPGHYGLGLTIGNAEVRLLELTNAYACLARLGEFRPVSLIESPAPGSLPERRFEPDACWLIADILSDPNARARAFGHDSPLRLPFKVAVKTGTSTDFRDNWTVGYTPEFTVGVWMGNFDNTPTDHVASVEGAAPIWRAIMLHLNRTRGTTWFARPPSIVRAAVDPVTGQPPPHIFLRKRPLTAEWFRRTNLPAIADTSHYDSFGRPLLPQEYASWLGGADDWLGSTVALGDSVSGDQFRVVSPLPGTTIYLDPDLPNSGSRFPLETNLGVADVDWSSPTAVVNTSSSQPYAILTEGRHRFEAEEKRTGNVVRTWVVVRGL